MIDIREDQMPVATPAKLRGLDTNGNSILVSLLSIQTMPYRGTLNNADINSIVAQGFYYLGVGNTNCPYESYSYLMVINLVGDAIQFNMHNGAGGIQYRKQHDKAWRNWQVIVSGG